MADFTASLNDSIQMSLASGATWFDFNWGSGVWGYGNPGDLWYAYHHFDGSNNFGFSQFEGSSEELSNGNFKTVFGGRSTNAENRFFPVYVSAAAGVTSWTCQATAGGAWV